jgi:hypothetical protein
MTRPNCKCLMPYCKHCKKYHNGPDGSCTKCKCQVFL